MDQWGSLGNLNYLEWPAKALDQKSMTKSDSAIENAHASLSVRDFEETYQLFKGNPSARIRNRRGCVAVRDALVQGMMGVVLRGSFASGASGIRSPCAPLGKCRPMQNLTRESTSASFPRCSFRHLPMCVGAGRNSEGLT